MLSKAWLQTAEILLAIALALALLFAWQAERRDRAQLAVQLATAQQTIAAASARQKDRDAILTETLRQIADLKRAAVTPAQILKALPGVLSLPVPLTLPTNHPSATTQGNVNVAARSSASPGNVRTTNSDSQAVARHSQTPGIMPSLPESPNPEPVVPAAGIPVEDLRPLYDFALDCKACQAKLSVAQANLTDEQTKTAALTKERDQAVQAAKGGSALHRILRAAKWFALGAAAGAIAAKTAR